MRKTFKLFCAAAIAALTVSSCGKIWDEFDSVHGQLDSIEARLDSLETSLNGQVATINTTLGTLAKADEKLAADIAALVKDVDAAQALLEKLDAADGTINGKIDDLATALAEFETESEKALAEIVAKIAVVKVEKNKAGNVVLTFADGSTLEVAAADSNANNTGLVTVVDGKWAVVGADGKTTVLDAVVHPDTKLDFKVEENTLFVSYDGGKTWEKTDVVVNDKTTINVVEDFKYTEGDAFVTITVGGKEYQLPLYEADNSSIALGRKEAYFVYGASKKVELAAKDIEEYYVMSKPDGWKATIDGTTLTVTAPAKALIDLGAAEAEGEVLVHATAATGVCKVVKLDVTAGEALKLSIKDGVVTLFNATLVEETDPMYGDVWYNFADVWFGLTPVTEYAAYESFEDFMATEPETLGNLQTTLFNNVDEQSEYVYTEGVYEEFVASMSLADIVEKSWSGFELVEDEVYVLWVVPQSERSFNYDEAVYVITDSYVDIDDTGSVYNNVSMDALFYGADGFVVGATDKAQFDEWGIDETFTYEDALAEYLVGNYYPGPLTSFNGGDLSAMGDMLTEGAHSLKLADVIVSGGMGGGMMPMPGMGAGASVSPDAEYFVWVMPYYKDKAEYTFEDLVLLTVKTEPLVENPAIKATVTLGEVTATSAVISLVPAEGGSTAYELMTAEDFEEYKIDGAVDQDMLIEYLQYNWAITEEDLWGEPAYVEEYGEWMIEPSTSYVFVTYNKVGGEYSIDYSLTFTTPAEVEVATPDKKQWMFKSEYMDMMVDGDNSSYCLDLGVAWADLDIPSLAGATVIAVDYGTVPEMAEQGAPVGSWYPAFPAYAPSVVTPTDEESGVVTFMGCDLPYSDFDGENCTFDFSELLGEDPGTVVFECTLAEEFVNIQAQ